MKRLMMLAAAAVAFCMTTAVNGAGLDGFCGFKAGELRKELQKSGKNGDQKEFEVKPKKQFRKFNRVFLNYSDSGRLAEVFAKANVRGMKAPAAKKEFEECLKYFKSAGISGLPGEPDEKWSDDRGCSWLGIGAVNTKDAHLVVRVEVHAQYRDPAMYKGDQIGQETGWILSIRVEWSAACKSKRGFEKVNVGLTS